MQTCGVAQVAKLQGKSVLFPPFRIKKHNKIFSSKAFLHDDLHSAEPLNTCTFFVGFVQSCIQITRMCFALRIAKCRSKHVYRRVWSLLFSQRFPVGLSGTNLKQEQTQADRRQETWDTTDVGAGQGCEV